jgi:hypothetical protein
MASLWEPVLAGALVVLIVVTVALVAAVLVAWRYGRRRWRAVRSHAAVVTAKALWEAARRRYRGPEVSVDSADLSSWSSGAVRRRMWRAVDRAEAAVCAADAAGAPTAELPSLCKRLQDTAVGLDRVLRIEPAGSVPRAVAAQAAEVARAARHVQDAAVASATEATASGVAQLTRDAGHEVQLLGAGLASARSIRPGPHP